MPAEPHRFFRRFLPLPLLLVLVPAVPGWAQTELIAARPITAAPVTLSPSPASLTTAEAADTSEHTSFADLFRHVGHDFRAFPSRDNLLWLGAGAALSAAGHPADRSVSHSLSSAATVEEALDPGTTVGGTIVQLGTPLLAFALGRAFDKPAMTHLGADLFRAQVLAQGVTQGIKYAANRTRPDGTSLSFPSGHAASSFATATVLQRHFGWKVGIPAYGLASYVAASRISENRHYLSDVIFGATIGLVAGRTVTIGHGKTRFAISPMAIQGGAGVSFVRIAPR
jgi:hypothetical protein